MTVSSPATTPAVRPDQDARLRGAIWGRLVGDAAALGSHWIYDLDEQQRQFPGGPAGFEPPAPGHYHHGRKPGDQTHYGDAALLLLDSVAERGRFDLPDFGGRFLALFREGTYPGYLDHATRGAVANYDAWIAAGGAAGGGVPFDFQRGADDDQPATVTRSAALIVRHHRDPDVLEQVGSLVRFAQDNPAARSFAAADAVLLLALLDGASVEEAVRRTAAQFSGSATVTAALDKARFDAARDPVAVTLEYGQSCPLPNTFPAAVQILLHHPGDYPAAIRAALRGGGDNAARGALVGGWLGAHLGLEAIPGSWRTGLSAAGRISASVDAIITQSSR
jgi:ADP-ribosyl-[dinitrogen reductase] hydrolase